MNKRLSIIFMLTVYNSFLKIQKDVAAVAFKGRKSFMESVESLFYYFAFYINIPSIGRILSCFNGLYFDTKRSN